MKNPEKKERKTFEGVRAKLMAYKDENQGFKKHTLPQSGIEVEIPNFLHHGSWMIAQRQAKNDIAAAQAAMVIQSVKFEGEKLTMTDVNAGMIDAKDMLFLIGELFGDDEGDEGGEGGAGKETAAA